MRDLSINFFKEGINFRLPQTQPLRAWLQYVVKTEKKSLASLNIILCSDEYLKTVNKTYLNHNYYTDVVTFDNSEDRDAIEGDIFISIDRVRDNALSYKQPLSIELRRVMVHGVLHLVGYGDKTLAEKSTMREKERLYLAAFPMFHVKPLTK